MNILSEEKIRQIAEQMPQGFMWAEGCNWESGILIQEAIDFARSIEAAVLEAQGKQEPVAWAFTINNSHSVFSAEKPPEDAYDEGTLCPLYAAPVVQSDMVMVEKLIECRSSVRLDLNNYELVLEEMEVSDQNHLPAYKAVSKERTRFLDSFSGALADLKRGQRTTENALAVLKKSPMVSTWDMSENKWLWRLVCDLKESGLVVELEQPYPWHRYALTDKGMALLPPNA